MKYLVFFFLISNLLFAVSSPSPEPVDNYLEKELTKVFLADVTDVTELRVENLTTLEPVPKGAHLVSYSPHPPLGLVHQEWQWEEKGKIKKTYGTASVRAFGKVAIARSPIKNGEAFSKSNVTFEKRELAPYAAGGYFSDSEHVYNLIAYGFVHAGAILSAANTQASFAVSRGEVMQLVHTQGSLEVAAEVRALKEGRVGDFIPVENTHTKKIIQARITSSGVLTTQ